VLAAVEQEVSPALSSPVPVPAPALVQQQVQD